MANVILSTVPETTRYSCFSWYLSDTTDRVRDISLLEISTFINNVMAESYFMQGLRLKLIYSRLRIFDCTVILMAGMTTID